MRKVFLENLEGEIWIHNKGYCQNDTLYWIEIDSPSVKHKFGMFEIKHAIRTGFSEPVFACDTEEELIKWFNY